MARSRGGSTTIRWSALVNLLAFVALTLVGIALLLGRVLSGDISSAFRTIAEVLAYVVVAFYALFWAIERRRSTVSFIVHLVIWAVAVTLIVVFMILR